MSRLFPVDLLVKGQQGDRRINHDVDALAAWCDLLGVKGRGGLNLTGLIELLRQAGQGQRISSNSSVNDMTAASNCRSPK